MKIRHLPNLPSKNDNFRQWLTLRSVTEYIPTWASILKFYTSITNFIFKHSAEKFDTWTIEVKWNQYKHTSYLRVYIGSHLFILQFFCWTTSLTNFCLQKFSDDSIKFISWFIDRHSQNGIYKEQSSNITNSYKLYIIKICAVKFSNLLFSS